MMRDPEPLDARERDRSQRRALTWGVSVEMRAVLRAVAAAVVSGGLVLGAGSPALAAPGLPATGPSGQDCRHASAPVPARSAALALMDPRAVWPLSEGAGVTVGVVDNAIDEVNPQLTGAVRVIGKRTTPRDCTGHGTRVAGIIAARPRADSPMVGMAPKARIVLAVAPSSQGEPPSAGALAAGISAAARAGARVIVVPTAISAGSSALHAAVRAAVVKGALVIASAGADQFDSSGQPPTYPAAYPEVLAVAGVDSAGNPVAGSASGPFVDLAAPAVGITSSAPDTGQDTEDGVTYAAAFVAGTAALLRGYRPDLSVTDVVARLELTATRPEAARRVDDRVGWGVVDPGRALTAVLPSEGAANLSPPPAGQTRYAPAVTMVERSDSSRRVAALVATAAVTAALILLWFWLLLRRRTDRGRTPTGDRGA